MANKAIPLKLLQGKGTNRPTRHGDDGDQVQIEPKIPSPPRVGQSHVLGPTGRKEWRRITGILANARVLTEADRMVLTQYCALAEQFLEDPREFKAAQHTQLRMCEVELGLTPSARMRLRE